MARFHKGAGKVPSQRRLELSPLLPLLQEAGAEIHIFRVRDGRIVEHRHQADFMGMMKQLGALPDGS